MHALSFQEDMLAQTLSLSALQFKAAYKRTKPLLLITAQIAVDLGVFQVLLFTHSMTLVHIFLTKHLIQNSYYDLDLYHIWGAEPVVGRQKSSVWNQGSYVACKWNVAFEAKLLSSPKGLHQRYNRLLKFYFLVNNDRNFHRNKFRTIEPWNLYRRITALNKTLHTLLVLCRTIMLQTAPQYTFLFVGLPLIYFQSHTFLQASERFAQLLCWCSTNLICDEYYVI